MPKYDLLLAGGVVVTGRGIRRADVGVRGETIAAVGADLAAADTDQVVDVSGRYLFPGVIDVHVHPVYLDTVEDCSRIAAYGGTTTLLHYAYARTGEGLLEKVMEMKQDGLASSRLDFGLHGGLFEAPRQLDDIPEVMKLGVSGFKFFMPYIKEGWTTDDYHLMKGMDMLADLGGMAMVHAENGGAIDYLEDKYLTGPDASADHFLTTRPAAMEEEAIFRAVRMAEVAGCPLYIPHNTTARALRHIREARQAGLPVFAETCPQYLTLTEEVVQDQGALAKIGPPIRTAADRAALWNALADGTIQVVGTDHAPKAKDVDGDFLKQPFGSPQIETLLPLVYEGGVNAGRISPARVAQVLSENPARIFGLYPKKGTIAVGSDADVVVFDPNKPVTIRTDNQHSKAGYTLYEGHTVLGWPEMTFQRGHAVLWRGEIVAEPGEGRFLATSAATSL
ncbi:MAG: amidohydrolase family protein [Anaerolineae bacterium]